LDQLLRRIGWKILKLIVATVLNQEIRSVSCCPTAEAPSLRMAETIADQVMVYCVLACVAVPVPSEGVTSDGREYIDHLSSGVLRGTNPANAADRLHAITLEAWRHRKAFARWKARRQRRGMTRRGVRPYATAALP